MLSLSAKLIIKKMFLKKLFPLAASLMLLSNVLGAQTVVKDADKFAALTAKLGNMSEDKIIDGILRFHNKEN